MPDLLYILFVFALGSCVGSFLNVVVWRLPRGESLVTPPSHCPKCNERLRWYDNIPIFGWIKLGGKCRYCAQPISIRYPIIEFVTAMLFVLYYGAFFIFHMDPSCDTRPMDPTLDWPYYALCMVMIACLLAASLIDAETFYIPMSIPYYVLFPLAIIVHTAIDRPGLPGALNANAPLAALSAGAGLGLLCSIAMLQFGIMPRSFPEGEPLLEHERAEALDELERAKREGRKLEYDTVPPPYSKQLVRAEIRKEMLFLMPPMILAALWWYLTQKVGPFTRMWDTVVEYYWFSGFLGSLLGAMVGGFVVWITRILGTLGFGRVAMGLGDVHLMFAVGAVIGGGAATVAFFLAPFFGIVLAIYMLFTGKRRELPYGPYLSLATAFVMLFYCPIQNYLMPGILGLVFILNSWFGRGGDAGGAGSEFTP
jgi:leader peptidase (prepilin peptidase)/N-methyltransferase